MNNIDQWKKMKHIYIVIYGGFTSYNIDNWQQRYSSGSNYNLTPIFPPMPNQKETEINEWNAFFFSVCLFSFLLKFKCDSQL